MFHRCPETVRIRRVVELPQLRIAEFGVGGHSHGCQSGEFWWQGSAEMATFVPDMPMDGQAKSSLMSALIDQHTDRWESGVRQSRCGLRGVRVGEVSHPRSSGSAPSGFS